MAGATTDARLPRCATEDSGRIEGHVSETHQIRFATSDGFGMKHLSRTVERIFVQLGSRRQSCLFAPDWKGKSALKNQNRRKTGRNQRKNPNDHPLNLNFPKRYPEASRTPSN